MLTAVAIIVDGLGFSAWLFLSSVGLTLIYGVMRILNIAPDNIPADQKPELSSIKS